MFKFENILVPTDFSEYSDHSLEYAKSLAKSTGSTLSLMHVIETTLMPATYGLSSHTRIVDAQSESEKLAQKKLDDKMGKLAGEGFSVKTELVHGSAAEKIIEYAKKNKVDAICIATQGSSGLERFLFGSVTEKVLRTAPCPVIAIRLPEYED